MNNCLISYSAVLLFDGNSIVMYYVTLYNFKSNKQVITLLSQIKMVKRIDC